jgi:hypothetical protein
MAEVRRDPWRGLGNHDSYSDLGLEIGSVKRRIVCWPKFRFVLHQSNLYPKRPSLAVLACTLQIGQVSCQRPRDPRPASAAIRWSAKPFAELSRDIVRGETEPGASFGEAASSVARRQAETACRFAERAYRTHRTTLPLEGVASFYCHFPRWGLS